jgi:hypothetical protein
MYMFSENDLALHESVHFREAKRSSPSFSDLSTLACGQRWKLRADFSDIHYFNHQCCNLMEHCSTPARSLSQAGATFARTNYDKILFDQAPTIDYPKKVPKLKCTKKQHGAGSPGAGSSITRNTCCISL